ncbi:hypothetical protein RHGRI_020322 [Rhododendron griersonianum]|uniref:Uncharacterized protein n=1 Tax=Rhododendron griersonianum TaxID=479676 RepID=A0AAV6JKH0_9ERIC|nr:hypothetical protein RHGRI_020322 [Rhododendron griersonianum]
MASIVPGNNFDALFPPLGLSSSTSASKLGFHGLRKPVSLLLANSLHCGSVPILVDGFGPSNDDQKISRSVGRVNLLDFLEPVTVTNGDHLEIQDDYSPTVKQIKGLSKEVRALCSDLDEKNKLIESISGSGPAFPEGVEKSSSWKDKVVPPGVNMDLLTASGKTVAIAIKYPWRPVKCGSCKVFGHSDCGQKVVQAPEGVTDPTKAALKGQVWVVKSDTSGTVMVSEAAEVHLDSGKVMHKESLGAASIRTDPSSSKVMEEPHYGTLPDVLGEGMEDPDALFQALTSLEMVDTNKPKEGKNPGAAKRGRKPKNQ